jgi:hypothetical protein
MFNSNRRSNPKALKLEGLENITRKVTIGFKCHPKIKLHLAAEAKKAGLTLSEFVETLIQELGTAVEIEKKEVETLKQHLSFYENDILLDLFKTYEKQEIKFTNPKGENLEITIKEPKDVYTILINSYKLKK